MCPIRVAEPAVIKIKHIDLALPDRSCSDLREDIIAGQGLRVVAQHGWAEFRAALLTISYGMIFARQAKEITALQPLASPLGPIDPGTVKAAETRADQLGARLQSLYPRESVHPFYSFKVPNKYWLAGKQKGNDFPLTRIYIGQRIDQVPGTFARLFTELEKRGCLPFLDLALNREIFFPDGNIVHNNAIIVYVMHNDRPILRSVCDAIAAAQVDLHLSGPDRACLKEQNIRDFLIPLAEVVAFIEMKGNVSYHTTIRHDLYIEMFGRTPYLRKLHLEEIQQLLDRWSPDNPGVFQGKPQQSILSSGKPMLYPPNLLANRRKYMPALLIGG